MDEPMNDEHEDDYRAEQDADAQAEHDAYMSAQFEDEANHDAAMEAAFDEANATRKVCEDIEGERMRQRRKWDHAFDDKHSEDDWNNILALQLGKVTRPQWNYDRRRHLVHLAAVAVAAIETMDRTEAREQAEHASDNPPADYTDVPF